MGWKTGVAVAAAATAIIAGGGYLLSRQAAKADTALASRATDAIAARGGRIISLQADSGRFLACGWADLGAPDSATPVMVYADPADPLTRPLVRVVAPRLHQGDLLARVEAAYERQLVLMSCDHGLMPPMPAGARGDDEALRTLWTSSDGAVIPTPGGEGFIVVRRRPGGGPAISPVFATREAARDWTN